MASGGDGKRSGRAVGLSTFLDGELARLSDGFDERQREEMAAAERQREVFAAWNAVCAGTREGAHVTGLYYASRENKLIVYLDGASWTQETTMLREIIRARMSLKGVDVDEIVCKTSRDGHRAPAAAGGARDAEGKEPVRQHRELRAEERAWVADQVAGIQDEGLKKAVENAMIASLEWSEPKDTGKAS